VRPTGTIRGTADVGQDVRGAGFLGFLGPIGGSGRNKFPSGPEIVVLRMNAREYEATLRFQVLLGQRISSG
jgi:hypothetical protein